jgi:hypothetical protein
VSYIPLLWFAVAYALLRTALQVYQVILLRRMALRQENTILEVRRLEDTLDEGLQDVYREINGVWRRYGSEVSALRKQLGSCRLGSTVSVRGEDLLVWLQARGATEGELLHRPGPYYDLDGLGCYTGEHVIGEHGICLRCRRVIPSDCAEVDGESESGSDARSEPEEEERAVDDAAGDLDGEGRPRVQPALRLEGKPEVDGNEGVEHVPHTDGTSR